MMMNIPINFSYTDNTISYYLWCLLIKIKTRILYDHQIHFFICTPHSCPIWTYNSLYNRHSPIPIGLHSLSPLFPLYQSSGRTPPINSFQASFINTIFFSFHYYTVPVIVPPFFRFFCVSPQLHAFHHKWLCIRYIIVSTSSVPLFISPTIKIIYMLITVIKTIL